MTETKKETPKDDGPPELARVRRAFDELRDAVCAALVLSTVSSRPLAQSALETAHWQASRIAELGALASRASGRVPALLADPPPAPAPAPLENGEAGRKPRKPRGDAGDASPPADPALGAAVSKLRLRTSHGGFSACERAVLAVLCARHPSPSTKTQIAILSGYSCLSGSFGQTLVELRAAGYVDGANSALFPTPDGIVACPSTGLPCGFGPELVDYWIRKLGQRSMASRILAAVAAHYPLPASRAEVVQATGYTGTSGSFGEAVMKLRGLELIGEEKKQWCASPYFFESAP